MNHYFDNAATSFPKPKEVSLYMSDYIAKQGGTYGRSAYPRAFEASVKVESLREELMSFLGTKNSSQIFFTFNATVGLNTLLFGMDLHDCHILTSPLEHNATMRPLSKLAKEKNITFDYLPHGSDGKIDASKIDSVLKSSTRLIIINHQSNINGVIQPVQKIKAASGRIPVLLDLDQSAGHCDIELDNWDIDFAAFTGHKGLLGPTGTGGIYIKDPDKIEPLIYGGTGSNSDSFEMPSFIPDKYEAGTPNVAGLTGLLGALENRPVPLHTHEDFIELLDKISSIPQLTIFKAKNSNNQGPVFSINHCDYSCSEMAQILYDKYMIETRSGLHCAPLAHKTLGTFPSGTVRFALSVYHTKDDFDYLLSALRSL